MLIYLLKSAACLFILLLFYKLILRNTSAHTFKRYYLLALPIIAGLIPLFTLTIYTEAVQVFVFAEDIVWDEVPAEQVGFDLVPFIFVSIYSIGFLLLTYRFVKNMISIQNQIKHNSSLEQDANNLILLNEDCVPHSFFNHIFISRQSFADHNIPEEILLHEQIHVKQKHSIDIIYIEILQCLFWFNPLFYFLKKEIQLNHEFLADSGVLQKGYSLNKYRELLLSYAGKVSSPILSHSFYYKPLKKRFMLMQKNSPKSSLLLRTLLIVPLIAILTIGFSQKAYAQSIVTQEGVSQKDLDTYNKLAKHYNSGDINKMPIYEIDVNRLKKIYKNMDEKQKKNAEPFPKFPEFPAKPISIVSDDEVVEVIQETVSMKDNKKTKLPPPPPPPIIEDEIEIVEQPSQKAAPSPPIKVSGIKMNKKNGVKNPPPPPPPIIEDEIEIEEESNQKPPPPPPPVVAEIEEVKKLSTTSTAIIELLSLESLKNVKFADGAMFYLDDELVDLKTLEEKTKKLSPIYIKIEPQTNGVQILKIYSKNPNKE